MKNKLLDRANRAGNIDLFLAIESQPERIQDRNKNWNENLFFKNLNKEFNNVLAKVEMFQKRGFSYTDGDYYIFYGKGGVKVHETPKGVKKRIAQLAHKYDLSVIVTDGIFYDGDKISVKSNGTIEDIEIIKNPDTLIMGGNIRAPYAIVSVFKDSVMVTRKLFVVPNDEYLVTVKMGSGNKYKTMMAYKMVYKRVLNGIYSLLGVTLDREDMKEIDIMAENMRVDDDEKKEEVIIDTIKEMEDVKNTVDILDVDSVSESKAKIGSLYSQEVDADRKAQLKKYGLELKGILDELNKSN